jgi:transposase InsO family protein
VAENVLDRRFEPAAADRAWAADLTSIPTDEGWLYLAAVEGRHSRRIVGWSMSERIDSRLVVDALEMAIAGRLPRAGLVAHPDRGSQYASGHHQRLLASHGITCSMSRRGDCRGNAPMESFFASPKKELVHGADFATREQARAEVFEYIEVFYNRVRRRSALGDVSPDEYERAASPLTPRSPFVGKSTPAVPVNVSSRPGPTAHRLSVRPRLDRPPRSH